MAKRRRWYLVPTALLVFLLGCFGTAVIDLTNSYYSTASVDSGHALVSSQGWIFTAGTAYQEYGIARINGATGVLAPGGATDPWGFGRVSNPTPSAVGWASFSPGGANFAATSMALDAGILYVTGPAVSGTYTVAGFGTVDTLDGSVADIRHFSPRDANSLGGYLGSVSTGDIFVVGGKVYVFGTGAAAVPVNDIVWVGQRELDGRASTGFGDSCGPGCTSGFATLDSGYNFASYGDTKMLDDIAYTVVGTSSSTEGRVLVTAIDLASPGTSSLQVVLQDGSSSSHLKPYAIAIQDDGKILVAGADGGGTDTSLFVVRYDTSGARDTTFGGTGIVELNLDGGADQVNDIGVLADGRILVVGKSGSSAFSGRLLDDGTWDTAYGTGGYELYTPSTGNAEFLGLQIGQINHATGSSGDDLLIAEL